MNHLAGNFEPFYYLVLPNYYNPKLPEIKSGYTTYINYSNDKDEFTLNELETMKDKLEWK